MATRKKKSKVLPEKLKATGKPQRRGKLGKRGETLLTKNPEIGNEICRLVAIGLSRTAACKSVGVHRNTFRNWLERAEFAPDEYDPHYEFYENLMKAEAAAEATYLKTIANASSAGDWKAAAWVLKNNRRLSKDWGEKHEVVVEAKPVNLDSLSEEELEQLLKIREKLDGQNDIIEDVIDLDVDDS